MGTVRRNFLKFGGGLATGVLFTPVPWKVLDDVSIWSQNWSWIPRPLRGEISDRYTNCTLCSMSCGVRARCVAGQPFQLAGIPNHPAGRPKLCPAGLAAHQLPYAATRISKFSVRGTEATAQQAMERAEAAVRAAQSVLVLDGRPGRSASIFYQELAETRPGWRYAATPRANGLLHALRRMLATSVGFDHDHVKTILSFGAPVLHGWAMPSQLLDRRKDYHLIQIEPAKTRTAAFADRWLPVRPGSEGAIALAISRVLLDEKLVPVPRAGDWNDYRSVVERFSPDQVASISGVSAEQIVQVAREFVAETPAIALPPAEPGVLGEMAETAIAGLNVLLGANGALTSRRFCPECPELGEIEDGSVAVLIAEMAENLPPSLIRRKLSPGGTVIAIASHRTEVTEIADIVLPVSCWLEAEDDMPGSPDAPAASFALAVPLLPTPDGAKRSTNLVARLCGVEPPTITARIGAVQQLQAGTIYRYADGSSVPASTLSSDEFTAALSEGGCWVDDRQKYTGPSDEVRLLAGKAPAEFVNTLSAVRASVPLAAVGPVMPAVPMLAKLYQESDLYPSPAGFQMNPDTALAHGLEDGTRASVRTRCGSGTAIVRFDDTAPPGLIQISGAPALRLCDAGAPEWRLPAADVRRA